MVLQVFYQYHLRLKWEHLFLFLATYCLFSCWRHIHKQYLVMAFPRPEQVVVDVESVVRDYLRPATAHSPPGDLPPKYEEVQAAAAQVRACMVITGLKIMYIISSTNCINNFLHIQVSEEEAKTCKNVITVKDKMDCLLKNPPFWISLKGKTWGSMNTFRDSVIHILQ